MTGLGGLAIMAVSGGVRLPEHRTVNQRHVTFVVTTLLAFLVIACGGEPAASGKYTQTWTKPYEDTVCTDWADTMDAHQKFVMAADFLLTAQRRDNDDATIPDDALIGQFQGVIEGVCLRADAGTTPVSEVALIAYSTQDQFAP